MTSLNLFQTNVYSEELYQVNETDHDAVMSDGWQEQDAIVSTLHGDILINKECCHSDCHTTRCRRDVRIGGIAV
jgi:hypothetical protein